MKQLFTFLCAGFTTLLMAQTVSIQGGSSYPTIAAAITAAVPGDIILVSGTFTESITIDKSITLRGTNPATDIIQAAAAPASTGTGLRVISIGAAAAAALNITVENLTIRHGNANANGGGIQVDKVTGLVNLNNLIVTNNFTTTNGGGISFAGSNASLTACTVQNNSCTLDGGAIIAAPNNASAMSNVVNINRSLMNANSSRNGGGLYINGNNTFGNNYKIDVNIENSTISNNTTTSAASGNGGGAVFVAAALWTTAAGGDGVSGNTALRLVHTTVFNNAHAAPLRAGLRFAGVASALTTFSAYNSIIVANNDVNAKALNFQNTNTTNVVNCILGGLELAPALVDDVAKNNQKGRTATQAGLTGTLSNQGGPTSVIDITTGSAADDFCSATTGISIPTVDQRNYAREGVNDAGAFEFGGTLSVNNPIFTSNSIKLYPNPATNVLNVASQNTISKVAIYDIMGRNVYESNSFNQTIDITNLAAGMHLLVLENDSQKVTKAFIKK